MRELIKEYQSILITTVAVVFVFACIFVSIPIIVDKADLIKESGTELSVIKSDNKNKQIEVLYPLGQRIHLIKNSIFNIYDYIVLNDTEAGEINEYKYSLYTDGKKVNSFDTSKCGGYYVIIEIEYKEKKIQSELLVVIEERL